MIVLVEVLEYLETLRTIFIFEPIFPEVPFTIERYLLLLRIEQSAKKAHLRPAANFLEIMPEIKYGIP